MVPLTVGILQTKIRNLKNIEKNAMLFTGDCLFILQLF